MDWLKSPDLRRWAHAGLNKGEARNALARAIFFHSLGELRDRTFENQFFRASGLNLLVAMQSGVIFRARRWTKDLIPSLCESDSFWRFPTLRKS